MRVDESATVVARPDVGQSKLGYVGPLGPVRPSTDASLGDSLLRPKRLTSGSIAKASPLCAHASHKLLRQHARGSEKWLGRGTTGWTRTQPIAGGERRG